MSSYTMSVSILSSLMGFFMKSGPEMFHYSMLGYSPILLIVFYLIMKVMSNDS